MAEGLYYNLCGYVSAAIVYEAITGKAMEISRLHEIGRALGINSHFEDNTIDLHQVAKIVVRALELAGVWTTATVYSSTWLTTYLPGGRSTATNDLTENWTTHNGKSTIAGIFTQAINRGDLVILYVYINSSGQLTDSGGIPHFAVLRSVGPGGVRIINPMTGNEEPYSWQQFRTAFAGQIAVIHAIQWGPLTRYFPTERLTDKYGTFEI